jgi:hypothetical protein
MSKTKLALAALVATGLAAAPFAAEAAKSHKAKHPSSTTSSTTTTTGASMKSNNPSSQGNIGPGTNQSGSMAPPSGTK